MRSLNMPEPVYSLSYRVIYGDTDAGGVMYNATYLRLFEMGRTEMMRECGFAYRTLEDQGMILPVTETWLRYKAPARYDDLLRIETALAEVTKYTCRFHYRIVRPEEERDLLLVKGFTVHACIDRQQGRLRPLPADLRQGLETCLSSARNHGHVRQT